MKMQLSNERLMALERVGRNGLTKGQIAILKALETWFDENPEPPRSMRIIAEMAQVSQPLVGIALPVLESLGYVEIVRNKAGRIINYGVILMMALGEEDL